MAARRGGVSAAPTPLLAQKGRTSRVTKKMAKMSFTSMLRSVSTWRVGQERMRTVLDPVLI